MLVGHYDTVWPTGTLARWEHPVGDGTLARWEHPVGDGARARGEFIHLVAVPAQTALVAGLLTRPAHPLRG